MRGQAAGAATAAREAGSGTTPGRSSLAVLSTPAGEVGGLWPAGGRRAATTGVGVLRRLRRQSGTTCSKPKGGVEWAFKKCWRGSETQKCGNFEIKQNHFGICRFTRDLGIWGGSMERRLRDSCPLVLPIASPSAHAHPLAASPSLFP